MKLPSSSDWRALLYWLEKAVYILAILFQVLEYVLYMAFLLLRIGYIKSKMWVKRLVFWGKVLMKFAMLCLLRRIQRLLRRRSRNPSPKRILKSLIPYLL